MYAFGRRFFVLLWAFILSVAVMVGSVRMECFLVVKGVCFFVLLLLPATSEVPLVDVVERSDDVAMLDVAEVGFVEDNPVAFGELDTLACVVMAPGELDITEETVV